MKADARTHLLIHSNILCALLRAKYEIGNEGIPGKHKITKFPTLWLPEPEDGFKPQTIDTVVLCLQSQTQRAWCIRVGVNGCGGSFFLAPSYKPCLCKPFCSVLRSSGCACSSAWPTSTCWSPLCSQRSSGWQSQASQLLWSDTSKGNPGSVLQGSCKLQPGLTQAVHQRTSAACPLSAGQLGKKLPHPTAQNGQREHWEFLISTCSLSQKRD